MVDMTRALRSAAQTGTVQIGYKSTLDAASAKSAKAVVLARNMPGDAREAVESAASAAGIPVIAYDGTNVELGPALGKPFAVSAVAVLEPGESDIMQAV